MPESVMFPNSGSPTPRSDAAESASIRRVSPSRAPDGPYDVAVVIPTVLRPTLARAVQSVYAQRFPGTIQILVGVDTRLGDPAILDSLATAAPANCVLSVFDPGTRRPLAAAGSFRPARGVPCGRF